MANQPSKRRRHWAIVTIIAAIIFAFACASCDNEDDDTVVYPTPSSNTVMWQGQCYVGYLYDEHEADMLAVPTTCTRVLYPAYRPIDTGVNLAIYLYLTRYTSYYHSGYYYDQNLRPMATRYTVTIIDKRSFTSNAATFAQKNSADIKKESALATWNGTRKKGAYDFPTNNAKARNRSTIVDNPTTTRRDSGTTNSRDNNTGKTGTKPVPVKVGRK